MRGAVLGPGTGARNLEASASGLEVPLPGLKTDMPDHRGTVRGEWRASGVRAGLSRALHRSQTGAQPGSRWPLAPSPVAMTSPGLAGAGPLLPPSSLALRTPAKAVWLLHDSQFLETDRVL